MGSFCNRFWIVSVVSLTLACGNINNPKASDNDSKEEVKEAIEIDTNVVVKQSYLDTLLISKLSLTKILSLHKPVKDIQFDLDKANWGGDDRVLLRNYFTEDQLFPKSKPKNPIAIREVVWKVGKERNITYWFQKKVEGWDYICHSSVWVDGTEF